MTCQELAIEEAKKLLGTVEFTENHSEIIDNIESEFGLNDAAWCVMFVLHCYKLAYDKLGYTFNMKWTASSQSLFTWAYSKGFVYYDTKKIKFGDICVWQHTQKNAGHAAICLSGLDENKIFKTIEGNTKDPKSRIEGVFEKNRDGNLLAYKTPNFHLRGFIDMNKVIEVRP